MKCGSYGNNSYLDVLNKHAPVANLRIKGNTLPYITAGAKAMIKQKEQNLINWFKILKASFSAG